MKLDTQKRLAAVILKCSPSRVKFDPSRSADIKEAITKQDIRALISEGLIIKMQEVGVSRVRARKKAIQRAKGLQRGPGKRKGKKTATLPAKQVWMSRVRVQRVFLKDLREKKIIDATAFKNLYHKSKGGFFRSKRHIKLYMNEHKLVKKEE